MDGQPIYQNQGSSETNPFAIVALILGILTGLLGIIFGHIALNQIEAKGQQGRGMAMAGLIIGYIWLGFVLLALLPSALY